MTSLRRLRRGPETLSAALRYATRHLSSSLNRALRGHVEAASVGPYLPFIHTILARGSVSLTSRHVDDTKVTDHHAIIPATQRVDPAALPPDEKRLYDLIARRFLAALYPDAALERTTLSTEVEGERFTTRGTVVLAAGWQEVDPVWAKNSKLSQQQSFRACYGPNFSLYAAYPITHTRRHLRAEQAEGAGRMDWKTWLAYITGQKGRYSKYRCAYCVVFGVQEMKGSASKSAM